MRALNAGRTKYTPPSCAYTLPRWMMSTSAFEMSTFSSYFGAGHAKAPIICYDGSGIDVWLGEGE